MYNNVIIKKRICLPYKFLDSNIKEHIVDHIKNNLEGDCSKEYGYIFKINNDLEILNHEISRISSDLLFTVSFTADTINPKNNDEIEGEVCMIFSDGIFVNVKDRLKILIPVNNIPKYKYNEIDNTFECDNKIIKVGQKIDVIINATLFNKKKISCFGSLKEI